jgi:hypothetical protein
LQPSSISVLYNCQPNCSDQDERGGSYRWSSTGDDGPWGAVQRRPGWGQADPHYSDGGSARVSVATLPADDDGGDIERPRGSGDGGPESDGLWGGGRQI